MESGKVNFQSISKKIKLTDLTNDQPTCLRGLRRCGNGPLDRGRAAAVRAKGDYSAGQEIGGNSAWHALIARMDTLASARLRWQDNLRRVTTSAWAWSREGFIPPKRHELGDLDKALLGTGQQRPSARSVPIHQSPGPATSAKDGEVVYTFATDEQGRPGAIGELCKAYGKHIRATPGRRPDHRA